MFNVGGGELLVILFLALVILGPDKLPEAARKLGQATREIRKVSNGFRQEIRTAMREAPSQPAQPQRPNRPSAGRPGLSDADSTPGETDSGAPVAADPASGDAAPSGDVAASGDTAA